MSSQAVMKRQILALAKREPSNEELQKIKQSLAVYKKLTKEEQTKINEMVNDAHAKLDSEGKFAKGGKTKTQSMKTALTEFKNKIGVKKFKRATTGTDIKKDVGIPAQKVGKRIVRKKGKTTNQYGTFKNQVGTTYYEGRPNRSDVNQPSEKRKIKLADGGQIKYAIVNDDSDAIYFRSPQLDLVKLKLKEFQEIYPNEKIIIQKFAKGGEIGEKSAKFKVGDEVYSYQNKTESAPIAYAKLSMWDRENGAHENDVWKYKLSLKDGYSNWINEDSLSKTKMTTYAEGGEIEVGSIVNLPEIKMKDGRVQYERVVGGEVIGFEDGIYDVLNPKTNRLHRVTKQQIEQIDQAKAKHTRSRASLRSNEDTYSKGTEFAKGGEVEKPLSYYKYETPKVRIAWKGKIQPLGMFKSAEEAYQVIENLSNFPFEREEYSIVTPDKVIHLGKEYQIRMAQGGTIKKSLAEFKNKVGASKYREATRGVDIKADLQIPALKKGRRVVTTKGKTSNQYGTFKNQVGSVYYENRPNHYDVNQPSEKRKIKLADGGMVFGAEKFWNELSVKEKMEWLKKRRDIPSDYKSSLKYDSFQNLPDWIKEKVKKAYTDNKIYKYAQGGTFANGGALEGAKIYVADLAEYNDGRLVGKWFDLSDYSDASELMEAIQEMLDEQTAKDKHGEVHEEWAVHDFEGFPRSFYSEYMGEKDFEKLYQISEVANDRGIPIDVLMEAVADFGADEDQIEEIADAYYGSVSTNFGNEFKDFAYEYIDSVGGFEGVSNSDFYFDFDSFGSDARMDYTDEELEEYGYDELDDTELGERLVDEMGGVDQLGQKTIEMYFDYDKFGRDLEHDFISVKGDDGDYYFFNRNW